MAEPRPDSPLESDPTTPDASSDGTITSPIDPVALRHAHARIDADRRRTRRNRLFGVGITMAIPVIVLAGTAAFRSAPTNSAAAATSPSSLEAEGFLDPPPAAEIRVLAAGPETLAPQPDPPRVVRKAASNRRATRAASSTRSQKPGGEWRRDRRDRQGEVAGRLTAGDSGFDRSVNRLLP